MKLVNRDPLSVKFGGFSLERVTVLDHKIKWHKEIITYLNKNKNIKVGEDFRVPPSRISIIKHKLNNLKLKVKKEISHIIPMP